MLMDVEWRMRGNGNVALIVGEIRFLPAFIRLSVTVRWSRLILRIVLLLVAWVPHHQAISHVVLLGESIETLVRIEVPVSDRCAASVRSTLGQISLTIIQIIVFVRCPSFPLSDHPCCVSCGLMHMDGKDEVRSW